MTKFNVERLHSEFGAQISGIDLNGSFSDGEAIAIVEAIDTFSFLVFPEQELDDATQLAFTRRIGAPEPNHARLGRDGVIDYFGTVGNVQKNGKVLGNDHEATKFLTGNNMWHTDSSFREVPSFVSINYATEVPEEGGQTQYVSARSAYDRLSDEVKQTIDPLIVFHDYVYSRSKVAPVTKSHAASLPPVKQKLVRKNSNNGAKNFYVGSHAREVVGWDEDRSRELLDGLLDGATGADHIYTHQWKPGQLVVWDNRCLLHRGTGYDADKYRRYMRQTRVVGKGSTLLE